MMAYKLKNLLYCGSCRPFRSVSTPLEPDTFTHCETCGIILAPEDLSPEVIVKLRFHLDQLDAGDYDDLSRVFYDAGRRYHFRVRGCNTCTRSYTIRCLCRRRKDLPPWDIPDTEPVDPGSA